MVYRNVYSVGLHFLIFILHLLNNRIFFSQISVVDYINN